MSSHGVPRVSGTGSRDVAKERRKIEEYNGLVALINAKIKEESYTAELLSLTTKLLSKNPEYYTIWNYRRVILQHLSANQKPPEDSAQPEGSSLSPVQQQTLNLLKDDLDLTVGFLLEYPKCYWIWKYRLWLLEQAEKHVTEDVSISLWQNELGLVGKMLSRDERNFHGWSYRRTVIANLERLQNSTHKGYSMAEDEFAYTTRMISSGLKNFSAWHNRSKLIPKLLFERKAGSAERRKMLDDELDLIQNALTDPFNQSAWDYHSFLIGTITPGSLVEGAIVQDLSNHDRIAYFEREMDRAKEMLEIDDDCKLIYEALLTYAVSYLAIDADHNYLTPEDLKIWLGKLRELDPLRNGRWTDLEHILQR